MYRERDYVHLKGMDGVLGRIIAVNQHSVSVKVYNKEAKKFKKYPESVAMNMIELASLDEQEIKDIPCGKNILSKNQALALLAQNIHFESIKRQEKRIYYCVRCEGYHTTSKPWMPISIKKAISNNPLTQEDVAIKENILCERKVFIWLRDIIGLKISHKWFKYSLKEFGGSIRTALEMIIAAPEKYIEYFFEKKFLQNHSIEIAN